LPKITLVHFSIFCYIARLISPFHLNLSSANLFISVYVPHSISSSNTEFHYSQIQSRINPHNFIHVSSHPALQQCRRDRNTNIDTHLGLQRRRRDRNTNTETHLGLLSDGVLWHVGCTDLLCDAASFTILNVCPPQLKQSHIYVWFCVKCSLRKPYSTCST